MQLGREYLEEEGLSIVHESSLRSAEIGNTRGHKVSYTNPKRTAAPFRLAKWLAVYTEANPKELSTGASRQETGDAFAKNSSLEYFIVKIKTDRWNPSKVTLIIKDRPFL